jgi:hypothetical protein
MDPSTYRCVAFLLSLGTMPIGCKPKDDGTTDGGTGGTGDATGGTSEATDGATGSTPTTSTGPTTTGSTTTGGTGETGGANESCAAYVAFQIQCDPEVAGMEAELFSYCAMMRTRVEAVYGPACLVAHDAVNHCFVENDCEDLDACAAELDASEACLPEAEAACTAFAAREAECYDEPVPEYAAGACQVYVNYLAYQNGPPCGAALEEWYACLVDLPCVEFEMQTGCDAQQEAIDPACGAGP